MNNILVLLHVLGACIWVGGHLVLALVVLPPVLRARDPDALLRFESKFERLEIPALLVQVLTGLHLAGHDARPADWFAFGDFYGTRIGIKLLLLFALVLLAAHARLRLLRGLTAERLNLLAAHIALVTAISIAFVVVGVSIRTGGF